MENEDPAFILECCIDEYWAAMFFRDVARKYRAMGDRDMARQRYLEGREALSTIRRWLGCIA